MRSRLTKRICMILVAALVLVSSSCVALAADTNANAETVASAPMLIGHRGYSGKYKENTIKALRRGYKAGFDGMEIDVWESVDGTLWVYHDTYVKDKQGNKIPIYQMTKQTRMNYLLNNGKTKIPSLTELLKACPDAKNLYIHIKGNGRSSVMTKAGKAKLLRTIRRYNDPNNVTLFASETIMQKLKFKGINTGWTTNGYHYGPIRQWVNRAKKAGVDSLILLEMSQLQAKDNKGKLVNYCHRRGIKIGIYSVKSKKQYAYLKRKGADFAISDYMLK